MDQDDNPAKNSGSSERSRRKKLDKSGKSAAFERLKSLKGSKNKYEIASVKNVYDEVDEKQYSQLVQERQDEDWIIDDDGTGYAENGREIFDEDDDDERSAGPNDKPGKLDKGHAKKGISDESCAKPKVKDIKSMFKAMQPKKKVEQNVNLENEKFLDDILQDLETPCQSYHHEPLLKKKVSNSAANSPSIINQTAVKTFKREFTTRKAVKKPVNDDSPIIPTSKRQKLDIDNVKIPLVKAEVSDIDTTVTNNENIAVCDNLQTFFDEDDDDAMMQDISLIAEENHCEAKTKTEELHVEEPMSTEWTTFGVDDKRDVSTVDISEGENNTSCSEGEDAIQIYWLDAYEDHFKNPGVVYLFGKVKAKSGNGYVSCCVTIRNIDRRVFLLPRENKFNVEKNEGTDEAVKFNDLYQEFNNSVASKFKIMEFKSKPVSKLYCFRKSNVPEKSDYLEVRYSAQFPELPSNLSGETFSHVFGTNTSSLELLLLDRKMKGPGWLEIKMPQPTNPPISWCQIEFTVTNPQQITVILKDTIPPLVVLSLGIKTALNPNSRVNEVIAASFLVHNDFHINKMAPNPPFQDHICALARPTDCIFPFDFKEKTSNQSRVKVERMESERSLLGFILAKMQKLDPDIIVGHDIFGFDIDVILHRIAANKLPHWSKLGRLKRSAPPRLNAIGHRGMKRERAPMCGRILCDIKISAKELIRCKSYDLTELTSQVLKKQRTEIAAEEIRNRYNSSQGLLMFTEYCMLDALYSLQLMYELNILPLSLQITNIAGNLLSRTLLGGRSERNEFLLLHAFDEKGYIVPDKTYGKSSNDETVKGDETGKKKKKAAYTGGLVLEPKIGFYNTFILLMDFNSLYPSIIQEYNICFTTIPQGKSTISGENEQNEDDLLLDLPDSSASPGILPVEIRKLVESRRIVKNLLSDANISYDLRLQYDIRQKALKLTANSMYGCLGFSNSRFYAKSLAAMVTGKGREILLQTKDLVQKLNLEVIYGDTDSLMINTNCTDYNEAIKIGSKIKQEVNKLYRQLEIEIDGIYKCMLLLKKKKYAAQTVQKLPNGQFVTSEELKGLDIVRRDWSEVACEAGRFIVCELMSGHAHDQILDNIHTHLVKLKEELLQDRIPLLKLTITKQLTKNPEDYPDKKSLPHVNVAMRVNEKGGKKLRQGDTVAYVICEDGNNVAAMQRAYHLDELKAESSLKIDKNYYLASQIHPVVSRLCEPIEGTDACRIAECLGLDPKNYRNSSKSDDAMLGLATQASIRDKFKDCKKFVFKCRSKDCGMDIELDGPFRGEGTEKAISLSHCLNPACKVSPAMHLESLFNKITMDLQDYLEQYYLGWLECDESACDYRSRRWSTRLVKGFPVCDLCGKGLLRPIYDATHLYNQLMYYVHIFDLPKAVQNLSKSDKAVVKESDISFYTSVYNVLKCHVLDFLELSEYSVINLGEIFSVVCSVKP